MPKFVFLLAVLLVLSAACGPSIADVESGLGTDEAIVPSITLVTPVPEGYPVPAGENGYPAAPVEAELPTGYLEATIVAPSREVDLDDLTPIPPVQSPQDAPSPARPGASPPAQFSLLMEAVTRDLSAQTGLTTDDIRLVSFAPMVWPNGGLGCPAEDMVYAEVLVEGALITLEADGQEYNYHTDGGNSFVLCQAGRPVSSGVVPRR